MVLNKQNGLLLSFSMGMESTHRYSRPIHTSVPVKQIQTLPQRDVGTARGRRPRNTRIVRKILNYLNFLNYSRLQWPVNRRARSNEGDWGFFYWIGIHWAYYQKLTPKVCHTPTSDHPNNRHTKGRMTKWRRMPLNEFRNALGGGCFYPESDW